MIFHLRNASVGDLPSISALIDASVRGLQARDYTPDQIDLGLRYVYGADSRLIADGTYFVVAAEASDTPTGAPANGIAGTPDASMIVGCGGWSRRKTLYGGDAYAHREDETLLDPACDAAKIRAFFVHPDWSRRGIGSTILRTCEDAALREGFHRLEMGSTLTGVALYTAHGYVATGSIAVPLPGGFSLPVIRMEKALPGRQISSGERLVGGNPAQDIRIAGDPIQ